MALPEELLTWYSPQQAPTIIADQRPELLLLLQLESGYLTTGEYDYKEGSFYAWSERFDDERFSTDSILNEADLINDCLEWELEEATSIRFWMWVPRPQHPN